MSLWDRFKFKNKEDENVFVPETIVYTALPGELGLFPACVMFSFESPYDKGIYYVLRMDQSVRDQYGHAWETFEVRSRWQVTGDPNVCPAYVDKAAYYDQLEEKKEPAPGSHPHKEGLTNLATLDPAEYEAMADFELEFGDDEDDD